jgi:hypothetical protein
MPPKQAWPDLKHHMKKLLAQPMLEVSGAEIIADDRDRF